MKSVKVLIISTVMVLVTVTAFAGEGREGGIGGGGGSGSSLVFVSLGKLFHDSLILSRKEMSLPGENEIDPVKLDQATNSVAVIPIADENTPEKSLTATQYKNFLGLTKKYGSGFVALYHQSSKTIFLFVQRFEKLIAQKPAAALALAVHEYLRAMEINDEIYKVTAQYYSEGFFQNIMLNGSGRAIVADRIESALVAYEIAKLPKPVSQDEIDWNTVKDWVINEALVGKIDGELSAMEIKLESFRHVQVQIAQQRDQIHNESRPTAEQLRMIGKAYGNLLRSVNMFKVLSNPMGGNAAADIAEAQFELQASAAGIRSKLNEAEALEEQAKFIMSDMKQTYDRKKKYTEAKDIAILGPMLKLLK